MFIKENPNRKKKQRENCHKLCNEKRHHPFEFEEKSIESEITVSSEFPSAGKVTGEQILGPEEINKSKRAGL